MLTYLQDSHCIYTQDSVLRQRHLHLLCTIVESAADAAQQQSQHLLAVLLRMRSSIMLDAPLDVEKLDAVSVTC